MQIGSKKFVKFTATLVAVSFLLLGACKKKEKGGKGGGGKGGMKNAVMDPMGGGGGMSKAGMSKGGGMSTKKPDPGKPKALKGLFNLVLHRCNRCGNFLKEPFPGYIFHWDLFRRSRGKQGLKKPLALFRVYHSKDIQEPVDGHQLGGDPADIA